MSRKSRAKKHRSFGKGIWKLIDDKSGFEIYSDEMKIQDWNGLVVSKSNYDDIPWILLPVKYPVQKPIPFCRPDNDVFVDTDLPINEDI